MTNANALIRLIDRCDIYFEGSLISKEQIIRKYFDFFASALSSENHSVSIALHTGSVCFYIISLLTTALGCICIDDTKNADIIESLQTGDFVLYGEDRKERYIWCGFADKDCKPISNKIVDKQHYAILRQPTKASKTYAPKQRWHLITPYNGDSRVTDGRGIKKQTANRSSFISHIFDIPSQTISSITGVSAVIVTERGVFDRISKGLEIVYDGNKHIGLLDIVTASYYADSGEEYQYGSNPAKSEPVLKITGKISTARDLALDKHGNKTVGLIVIGSGALANDVSELTDLLGRKSLRFVHVTTEMDSDIAEGIIESQESTSVFACTKEFLLQNSLPLQEDNPLTSELDRQIGNIVNNAVTVINVGGGCSWEDFKKVREELCTIKKSGWDEEKKNNFIISAYSLLNLFTTSVFPMKALEEAVNCGKLNTGVTSPSLRVHELWNLAESAGSLEYSCAFVADTLERLYQSILSLCPKYETLKEYLDTHSERKVAIVVPKAYYVDILTKDEWLNRHHVNIVTANRFNCATDYDEIIAVGDFAGKRFNPLKCRVAETIIVLLYEGETHLFRHKKQKASSFEKKINSKLGLADSDSPENKIDIAELNSEVDKIDAFVESDLDLENYIDSISTFDIGRFAIRASSSAENTPTCEVCTIGRFSSGEQILFSKYYNAVVFDTTQGMVTETDVEKLVSGDLLVFAKRNDYTQNMVDYIYESLQSTGRLSKEVVDATEKAFYWKEALREYKNGGGFSYKEIAKKLRELGSSLQEVSIRQWLIEESHIVGPRDEKTLEQIAELTGDSYLLSDTESYFEACRIVRRQRKEILELIGKAITDKLSGHTPPKGSILEIVYGNVKNLSETLELESISQLDEPIAVPINIINKPITEAEVSI